MLPYSCDNSLCSAVRNFPWLCEFCYCYILRENRLFTPKENLIVVFRPRTSLHATIAIDDKIVALYVSTSRIAVKS